MAGFSGSTGVNKKYVDDAIAQSTANKIVAVGGRGSGTITSSGGSVNIDITFAPPSDTTFIGEVVDLVSASDSTNNINTLVRISRGSTTSTYRCVSASAQTVAVSAIRLYRM